MLLFFFFSSAARLLVPFSILSATTTEGQTGTTVAKGPSLMEKRGFTQSSLRPEHKSVQQAEAEEVGRIKAREVMGTTLLEAKAEWHQRFNSEATTTTTTTTENSNDGNGGGAGSAGDDVTNSSSSSSSSPNSPNTNTNTNALSLSSSSKPHTPTPRGVVVYRGPAMVSKEVSNQIGRSRSQRLD
jgi:hypothetical protein